MFSLTEIARIPEIVAIDEKFFPIIFHFDKDAACLLSTEKLLSPLEWGTAFIAIKDSICDIKANWYDDGFESIEYLLPETKTFFIKIIVHPLAMDVAEVMFQPLTKCQNVLNNLGDHYYQIVFRRNDTLLERIMAINEALFSGDLNADVINLLQRTHGVPSFVPDKRSMDQQRKDKLPDNYKVASCPELIEATVERLLNESADRNDNDDDVMDGNNYGPSERDVPSKVSKGRRKSVAKKGIRKRTARKSINVVINPENVTVQKRILRKRKIAAAIGGDDDADEHEQDEQQEEEQNAMEDDVDAEDDDDENDIYDPANDPDAHVHDSDDSADLTEFLPLAWQKGPMSKKRVRHFNEKNRPFTSAGIIRGENDGSAGKMKRSDVQIREKTRYGQPTILPGKELAKQRNEAAQKKNLSTGMTSDVRMPIDRDGGTSPGFQHHIAQRTHDVIKIFKSMIQKYVRWYQNRDCIELPAKTSTTGSLDIDRTKLFESMVIEMCNKLYGQNVTDDHVTDVTQFICDHVEEHFINGLQ